MSDKEQSIREVVGALAFLEKKFKRSPSVKEISEQSGFANGTTYNYLREAVSQGLIVQNDGKFMTLELAKAFEKGK
jgi:DNA-binding IclR family transcriptional regulator